MSMIFLGLSLCTCAAGHAYISWPIGRQLAASTIQGAHGAPEFDKQSWSGKGAGNFIANCGSPTVDGKYEDAPEKWAARGTFAAGEVVDFVITFTAQHNGAHGFRIICADSRMQERLPPFTDAAWTNLKRSHEDPNHMTDFHRTHFTDNDWDTMAFIPQAVGNHPATVQFVIPADFPSCNHAVIQWWWKTANSCTPRLFQGQRGQFTEDAAFGECAVVAPSDDCIDGDCQMEQFNNCADVVITGRDSITTGTTTLAQSDATTTGKDTSTTTSLSSVRLTTTVTTSMTTTGQTTSVRGGTTTADDIATSFVSTSATSVIRIDCRASSIQATDQWCMDNCNHVPAFCPPAFCFCEEQSSSDNDGPCSGMPCSDTSLCRSRFGYCGSSSYHCDHASTWKASDCASMLFMASIKSDVNVSTTNSNIALLSKARCSLSSIMQILMALLVVCLSTN